MRGRVAGASQARSPSAADGLTTQARAHAGPPATTAASGRPGGRPTRGCRWRLASAVRLLVSRHPALRYLQIIPVGLVLWGLDVVDRFRSGAALAGFAHAVVVNAISRQLGGGFADQMNDWLAVHPAVATAAAWYYIVVQGAVTGIVGLLLIWRRVPNFRLHRDALIACNAIGLVVFWLYPVAPPRMLPGYHDITAAAVPVFSSLLEGRAASQFSSLPSLHVTWALWVAVAAAALVKHPALRAALWLYPVLTALDVLATANHYWLDAITAVGVLALAYALAASLALVRQRGLKPPPRRSPRPAGTRHVPQH